MKKKKNSIMTDEAWTGLGILGLILFVAGLWIAPQWVRLIVIGALLMVFFTKNVKG